MTSIPTLYRDEACQIAPADRQKTILNMTMKKVLYTLLLVFPLLFVESILGVESDRSYLHQYSAVIESGHLKETYKREYSLSSGSTGFNFPHLPGKPTEVVSIKWQQNTQSTLILCLKPESSNSVSTHLHSNQGKVALIHLSTPPGFKVYKLHLESEEGHSELALYGGSLIKECNMAMTDHLSETATSHVHLALFSKKRTSKKKISKKNALLPVGTFGVHPEPEALQNTPLGFSSPFDPKSLKPPDPKVFFYDTLVTISHALLQPDINTWESENNVAIDIHYGPWHWLLNLNSQEWAYAVETGLSLNTYALLQLAQSQSSARQQRSELLNALSQNLQNGQTSDLALWLDELEGIAPERLSIYSWAETQFLNRIFGLTGYSLPRLSQYQSNPEEYIQKLQQLLNSLSSQHSLEHSLRLLGDLPETLISELTQLEEPELNDPFAVDTFLAKIANNLSQLWAVFSGILAYNLAPATSFQVNPSPTAIQASGSGNTASTTQTSSQTNTPSSSTPAPSQLLLDTEPLNNNDELNNDPPDDEAVHSKSHSTTQDLAYYVNQVLTFTEHTGDDLSGAIQVLEQTEMIEHFKSLLQLLDFDQYSLDIPSIAQALLRKGYLSKGFLLTFIWLTKRYSQPFYNMLDHIEGALLIIQQLETGGFYIIREYLNHNQLKNNSVKGINKELLDVLSLIAVPSHNPNNDSQYLENRQFSLRFFFERYQHSPESAWKHWHRANFKAQLLLYTAHHMGDGYALDLNSQNLLSQANVFFQFWLQAGVSTLKREGDKLILTPDPHEESLTPRQFVEILKEKTTHFSTIELFNIVGVSDATPLTDAPTKLIELFHTSYHTRKQWLDLFGDLIYFNPSLYQKYDLYIESWHYELVESEQGHLLIRQSPDIYLRAINADKDAIPKHPISRVKQLIANTLQLANCILRLLPEDLQQTKDIHGAAQRLIQTAQTGVDLTDLWQHPDLIPYHHLKNIAFYKDLHLSIPALDLLAILKLNPDQLTAAEVMLHQEYLRQLLLNDIYDLSSPLADELLPDLFDKAASRPVKTGQLQTLLDKHLQKRIYSKGYLMKKLVATDPVSQGELICYLDLMELSHLASQLFDPLDYKLLKQFLNNDPACQAKEQEVNVRKRRASEQDDSPEASTSKKAKMTQTLLSKKRHKLLSLTQDYKIQNYQKLEAIKAESKHFEDRELPLCQLKRWASLNGAMPANTQFEEESIFTFLLSMSLHWNPSRYANIIQRLEVDTTLLEAARPEPPMHSCPAAPGCLLIPTTVMELAAKHISIQSLQGECYCDGCGKALYYVDYLTDQHIVNQPVIQHCYQHNIDICNECLNQVCTLTHCNQPLTYQQTIRRNFQNRRDSEESFTCSLQCDHCKRKLADVSVQSSSQDATNTKGQHIKVTTGQHYIFQCPAGHDICTSCLLASREKLNCLLTPTYTRATQYDASCLICHKPIAYREVVHHIKINRYIYLSHKHCTLRQSNYCQPLPAVKPPEVTLDPRKKELASHHDEAKCLLCCEKEKKYAFLHESCCCLAACEDCAKQILKSSNVCPYCRRELTGQKIIKIVTP